MTQESDKKTPSEIVPDRWEETAASPPAQVTCNSAYDHIIRAMVDFDPELRFHLRAKDKKGRSVNLNPDLSLRKHEPDLPPEIAEHVASCPFCQQLIKLLSGLKLKEGHLAIKSNLSAGSRLRASHSKFHKALADSGWQPKRDEFRGTPSQIVETMVKDASKYIKPGDDQELMHKKAKFIKKILSLAHETLPEHDDSSITITDLEFIKVMARKKIVEVVADPWFLLSPRPINVNEGV